jgi:hypothetical protein
MNTSAASLGENSIETTLLLRSDVYPKSTYIVNFAIDPKVNTLKFCVGDHCHIFQLNRTNTILTCLREFIKDRLIGFPGLKNLTYLQYLNWLKHTLEMYTDLVVLTLWEQRFLNDSVDKIVQKCLEFTVQYRRG